MSHDPLCPHHPENEPWAMGESCCCYEVRKARADEQRRNDLIAALLVDVICEQDADLRAERTRYLRLLRRNRVAEEWLDQWPSSIRRLRVAEARLSAWKVGDNEQIARNEGHDD